MEILLIILALAEKLPALFALHRKTMEQRGELTAEQAADLDARAEAAFASDLWKPSK